MLGQIALSPGSRKSYHQRFHPNWIVNNCPRRKGLDANSSKREGADPYRLVVRGGSSSKPSIELELKGRKSANRKEAVVSTVRANIFLRKRAPKGGRRVPCSAKRSKSEPTNA